MTERLASALRFSTSVSGDIEHFYRFKGMSVDAFLKGDFIGEGSEKVRMMAHSYSSCTQNVYRQIPTRI